jgi:hypothetical protein
MSRIKPVTPTELKANFEKCLKDAVELGIWPPSDQGFDDVTNLALVNVAKAYPHPNSGLVSKAKQEMALQLNGTHSKAAADEWDRLLRALATKP